MNGHGLNKKQRIIKRAFDLIFGTLTLFILMPFFIIISLAIALSAKGPVLFRQTRTGLNGKPFYIYKFRTMVIDADNEAILSKDIHSDYRITRIGQFLRKTSLDELPQFWNVLKGDMSIVGPRPMIPSHIDYYTQGFNIEQVLLMKPGITGWSQVRFHSGGFESSEIMKLIVEHDNYYQNNWSFLFDLKIIARTIFIAYRAQGAF